MRSTTCEDRKPVPLTGCKQSIRGLRKLLVLVAPVFPLCSWWDFTGHSLPFGPIPAIRCHAFEQVMDIDGYKHGFFAVVWVDPNFFNLEDFP